MCCGLAERVCILPYLFSFSTLPTQTSVCLSNPYCSIPPNPILDLPGRPGELVSPRVPVLAEGDVPSPAEAGLGLHGTADGRGRGDGDAAAWI